MNMNSFEWKDFILWTMNHENPNKMGFKNGRYYQYKSQEGGADTIGYGHKLQKGEDFSNGLTYDEVMNLLNKDLLKSYENSKTIYDKKYGKGSFEKLPFDNQKLATRIQFNVRDGLSSYPHMMEAMHVNNYQGVYDESVIHDKNGYETGASKDMRSSYFKDNLENANKSLTEMSNKNLVGKKAKPRTISQGRQNLSIGGNIIKTIGGIGMDAAAIGMGVLTAGAATPASVAMLSAGTTMMADGVSGISQDVQNKKNLTQYPANKQGMKLFLNGGNLNKLNSSTMEVNANNPSMQDSVQIPQLNAAVDDGETIDLKNGRVYSDKLGVADVHKKIAKKIAKIENAGRKDKASMNALERLKMQEDSLFAQQEAFKQMHGIDNEGKKMRMGGKLNKYVLGGGYPTDQYGQLYIKPNGTLGNGFYSLNPNVQQLLLNNKTLFPDNPPSLNYNNINNLTKENLNQSLRYDTGFDLFTHPYINQKPTANFLQNTLMMNSPNAVNFSTPSTSTLSTPSNPQEFQIKTSPIDEISKINGIKPILSSPTSSKIPSFVNSSTNPSVNSSNKNSLTAALQYAPSIYKTMEGLLGKANKEKPIYARTSGALNQMKGREYNISPQLNMNRNTYNTQMYNAKNASPNSGAWMNIGNAAALNKYQSDMSAWAQKQNMDNQYKGEYANALMQDAQNRQSAEIAARQQTLANKVAKQSMFSQGLSDASALSINNSENKQQQAMDLYKLNLLSAIYPDVNPNTAKGLYSIAKNMGWEIDENGMFTSIQTGQKLTLPQFKLKFGNNTDNNVLKQQVIEKNSYSPINLNYPIYSSFNYLPK